MNTKKNDANEKKEKWYERFHDDEFTRYYESGEATCVFLVRDTIDNLNTSGKWIDVLSHTNGFQQITVELFPRITNPKYTSDVRENSYKCWRTAHDDIATHRENKQRGKKYEIQTKKVKIIDEGRMLRIGYLVTDVRKIK